MAQKKDQSSYNEFSQYGQKQVKGNEFSKFGQKPAKGSGFAANHFTQSKPFKEAAASTTKIASTKKTVALGPLLLATAVSGTTFVGATVVAIAATADVSLFSSSTDSLVFRIDGRNIEENEPFYAVLSNGDRFNEKQEILEATSFIPYYGLEPNSPYRLDVFYKDNNLFSGSFLTAAIQQEQFASIEIEEYQEDYLRFFVFNHTDYPFLSAKVFSKSTTYFTKDIAKEDEPVCEVHGLPLDEDIFLTLSYKDKGVFYTQLEPHVIEPYLYLSQEQIILDIEEETVLYAYTEEAGDIHWSVEGDAIELGQQVTASGEALHITAIQEGEATITARIGDLEAFCRVFVNGETVEPYLMLSEDQIILQEDESAELFAYSDLEEDIHWQTDSEIISLAEETTASGDPLHITALAPGEALISATVGGLEAYCTVIVEENSITFTELSLSTTYKSLEITLMVSNPDMYPNTKILWDQMPQDPVGLVDGCVTFSFDDLEPESTHTLLIMDVDGKTIFEQQYTTDHFVTLQEGSEGYELVLTRQFKEDHVGETFAFMVLDPYGQTMMSFGTDFTTEETYSLADYTMFTGDYTIIVNKQTTPEEGPIAYFSKTVHIDAIDRPNFEISYQNGVLSVEADPSFFDEETVCNLVVYTEDGEFSYENEITLSKTHLLVNLIIAEADGLMANIYNVDIFHNMTLLCRDSFVVEEGGSGQSEDFSFTIEEIVYSVTNDSITMNFEPSNKEAFMKSEVYFDNVQYDPIEPNEDGVVTMTFDHLEPQTGYSFSVYDLYGEIVYENVFYTEERFVYIDRGGDGYQILFTNDYQSEHAGEMIFGELQDAYGKTIATFQTDLTSPDWSFPLNDYTIFSEEYTLNIYSVAEEGMPADILFSISYYLDGIERPNFDLFYQNGALSVALTEPFFEEDTDCAINIYDDEGLLVKEYHTVFSPSYLSTTFNVRDDGLSPTPGEYTVEIFSGTTFLFTGTFQVS